MYKNSHQDDVTILYGSPLLDRFIWSGYASLIGEYTQNDLHYFFERKVTKKESSCSSCSSGGCGSSCSGGGDGGGCGGCGGGDKTTAFKKLKNVEVKLLRRQNKKG